MLDVQNVTAVYRDHLALDRVSLRVHPGELLGVMGPNGAGKSTLLKAIVGLVTLKSGLVAYGDCPVGDQKRKIAYVPQRAAIDWDYPISVEQAVLTGRTVQRGWWRRLQEGDHTAAYDAMERLGITQWRHRPVGELSGGQQQRVFLARAIAQDASVFLLDEPLTGVDRSSEELLWGVVEELRQAGKILLVSSHERGRSLDRYNRLALLNRSLVAVGRPQEVLNPDNMRRTYDPGSYDPESDRPAPLMPEPVSCC